MNHLHSRSAGQEIRRRTFFSDLGLGFTGLVMGAMLHEDGIVRADSNSEWSPPDGRSHFPAKAKSVIWMFMGGGVSHLETFDPKPALNKYAGKLASQTPYGDVLDAPFLDENFRKIAFGMDRQYNLNLYPLQVGFRKHGQSGIEVSDFWPNLCECIDDMAIIRSMWTSDNDHTAQAQFHTGRHVLDGCFPTIGSWISHGLGTMNENLPQFVTMGYRVHYSCGAHTASYLGPQHDGVALKADPDSPLPYAKPELDLAVDDQQMQFQLLGELNRLAGIEYPDDAKLQARIKSYELAFRMQTSVPEALDFRDETEETRRLYGLDRGETREFGTQCLAARRFIERGVRFVQLFNGCEGAGQWDAHDNLRQNHARQTGKVDQPIAALLKDLKRRGMLDETLVVWGTEFGRTPGLETLRQVAEGRDHHPFGFSTWMAGGGIKGGIAHGATDELGFHAVEDRHYVTDLHATVLHQLGLDPHRLVVPGRQRLEIDYGKPIHQIIA